MCFHSPRRKKPTKSYWKWWPSPFTKLVIQLDKKVIEAIALGDKSAESKSLVKQCKGDEYIKLVNETVVNTTTKETSFILVNKTMQDNVRCNFLFSDTKLNDTEIGIILLVFSIILLCICLVLHCEDLAFHAAWSNGQKSSRGQWMQIFLDHSDISLVTWLS